MIGLLLTGATGASALVGGLGYRKMRQRQVAAELTITSPNKIVEERFVPIGGIEQWIQIRGEDRANPVLLMVHGGPGWPNAVFTHPLRPWEKHFTIVQWDQRGAGKTFGRHGKTGSGEMTFGRRVSDAVELVEFLRQYLHKERVILLAESMGTLTGVPLAQQRPDLFSALVVTDLYVDMHRNEAFKFAMTLNRLHAMGDRRGVAALEKIGADPGRWDLAAWQVNMGLAFRTNVPTANPDRTLLLPLLLTSPIYSLRDLYHLFAGFRYSTETMFQEFRTYDARRSGIRFEVPLFLFQGESDVITVTRLAEEYFAEVKAPLKECRLIPNAGHFAAFTQPDRFLAQLLRHVRPLACQPNDTEDPASGSAAAVPELEVSL